MPWSTRQRGRRLVAPALLALWALGPTACARREAPAPASTGTAPSSLGGSRGGSPAVVSVPLPRDEKSEPSRPWAAAVRGGAWEEAAQSLAALPAGERARPEVRYAEARVALARGRAEQALPLLEGLETALPLLAEDVLRHRAEAMRVTGPYDRAAEYFAGRPAAASQLKAAEAYEKARDLPKAKAACDRVVTADGRSRGQEAEARGRRLRLFGDVADARWIAVHAPDLPIAKDAEAMLARTDGAHPLTTGELVIRARALADGGRVDDALATLDRLPRAPGPPMSVAERLHLRGDLLYRARARYADAARVLAESAAAGGPHAADDALKAARALSRADRDTEAVKAYGAVSRRYPKTAAADEATFLAPYLELLHGRSREAVVGFDEYLTKFPGGTQRAEARRLRAVATLLAKDHRRARRLFEELADDHRGDPLLQGRMASLAALAALRDGDRTHAVARWTELARARPLSWPALVARARLREVGAPLPPLLESPAASETSTPGASRPLPPPAGLLHELGFDDDAEAALRPREAAIVASAPGRSLEALCEAYGRLDRSKRRYQLAQDVPLTLLVAGPTAASRWAWDCVYPRPHKDTVTAAEAREGLPRGLVHAVMRQESGFDPDAVSPAGAVGLLQLMPATAQTLAASTPREPEQSGREGDPADDGPVPPPRLTAPRENVTLGARYLRDMLQRFGGQVTLAVAAYNAGPDAVLRWLTRSLNGGGAEVDTFVERIPYAETRGYVVRVMGNLARYAYLDGRDDAVPDLPLALTAAKE